MTRRAKNQCRCDVPDTSKWFVFVRARRDYPSAIGCVVCHCRWYSRAAYTKTLLDMQLPLNLKES